MNPSKTMEKISRGKKILSSKQLRILVLAIIFVSNLFPASWTIKPIEAHLEKQSEKKMYYIKEVNTSYNTKLDPIEFYGDYSCDFPLRATLAGDPFSLDFYEDFEQARAIYAMYRAMGLKVILYRAFSSLSENMEFMNYWNLTKEEISPMDLNGFYWVALPYTIGYEGREAWRAFFIKFIKLLFDAGVDGIEIDGGEGCYDFGSFDPETIQKFNQYLSSKYTKDELLEKFGITDINSFNFTQYLRDRGYHKYERATDGPVIANPGNEPAKDPDPHVRSLWEEWDNFKKTMLLELYKLLWKNVKQWEQETGRRFYISTRVGLWPLDLPVLPFVDGVNWEYVWFSAPAFGDRPDIIGYPNRTASTDFRVLQSLGKRFNPWITPASSLGATGFSAWFSCGWNMTSDPEEQYLALSEIIVCGGLPGVKGGDEGQAVNTTHWKQFTQLVQENPQLFGQSQFGEIALIYPAATALNWNYKLNFTSPVAYGQEIPLSYDGYEGTYYLLADSHRVFDIIVFGDNVWVNITQPLSKLLEYKAVVLPMALCLTDDQVELLEQYLQSGGIIIALGDVGIYNEYVERTNRKFSSYFDGQIHQVGQGLIISIKDISPIDYLAYRTKYDPKATPILERFREIIDTYVPREVNTSLPSRAHIYRFFNYKENILIFHIINFVYDYKQDKVIRAYNVNFNFTLPPQLQGKKLSIWIYSEDLPCGMEIPYKQNGNVISITIPKVSILTSIEVRPHFEVPEPLVIDEPTILKDSKYIFDRSVIIKSSLSIINSQIEIKGGVKPVKIEVLPGGSLTIINSTIRKVAGSYYIVARKDSSIIIKGSDISAAGLFGPLEKGGICIQTEGAVILNSKIHDNYDYGLLLFNANYSLIANNEFYGNRLGVSIVDSSFIQFHNNTVKNNYAGVLIRSSHVELGIADLVRMYNERGILPPRGPAKQVISNCRIINNQHINIVLAGTNFATIANSECGSTSVINILVYRSIAKIFNCTIHTSWMGILLYESPIVTITNNRIYNHTRIGIKIYKCCGMGILHWLHLEPIAAYSDEGDIRIIGNHIENNGYGIHMDFEGGPYGYFNRHIRISGNIISHNLVGIFVSRTVGEIIRNNFIENKRQIEGGKYEPLPALSIDYPKAIGNYWDTYSGPGPYEVLPNYYDYYPLKSPVKIPIITDYEGPIVKIENAKIKIFNETHVVINFNLHVSDDQSYLGDTEFRTHFGFVSLLSPNMKERDFGWIGLTVGVPGPEKLAKTHSIYDFTFVQGWTAEMKPVPLPEEWVEDAILSAYATDIWGNWNKNDTVPPYIKVAYISPETISPSNPVTLNILVIDWNKISKVRVIYKINGSEWRKADIKFDKTTQLYRAIIPPLREKGFVTYRVYAEDICGNGATYTGKFYIQESYTISFYVKDTQGNIVSEATLVFNGVEHHHGEKIDAQAGTYSLSIGTIPSGYKFSNWSTSGDISIENPSTSSTTAIVNGDGNITMILNRIVIISNLTVKPQKVNPGETVTITIEITNTIEDSLTYTIKLLVNDYTEATKEIKLSPRETKTITFTITKNKPGTYSIEINGLKGKFTVEEKITPPTIETFLPYIIAASIIAIALIALRFIKKK